MPKGGRLLQKNTGSRKILRAGIFNYLQFFPDDLLVALFLVLLEVLFKDLPCALLLLLEAALLFALLCAKTVHHTF